MNTIIIAVIAIIVLLLIVTFFTGGFGKIVSRISEVFGGGIEGADIELARSNCKNYCEIAKTKTSSNELVSIAYCTRKVNIDINKDNKIEGENEEALSCWESPINVHCTVTTNDGTFTDARLCDFTPAR